MDKFLVQWLPLILIVAVFYFLIIRPQQRRQRDRASLLRSVKTGDKVVTIGGLHGTVADMDDTTVTLRVGDNTKLVFERSAVNTVKEKATE